MHLVYQAFRLTLIATIKHMLFVVFLVFKFITKLRRYFDEPMREVLPRSKSILYYRDRGQFSTLCCHIMVE